MGESGDGRDDDAFAALLGKIARSPDVAPATELIGRSLGRYKIEALLGRGGMGVVYRATDSKLAREVAIKVLPPEVVGDGERRARFLREARLAAAVTHPCTAAVYDVGDEGELVYVAMELVRGRTLRAILDDAPGGLPFADVVRIGRDVARGLAKAHEAGIVHRDLKPENVMVDGEGHVKILDFGLAKLREGDARGATQSTEEGRLLGTPRYMSPEQAKGRRLDARSDLFSLGVVLYELVTGARPFEAETTVEVLIAIDRDEPPPIATRRPSTPTSLVGVIERCLEKDPAARPASARDVADALETHDVPRARLPRTAWLAVAGFGVAAAAVFASAGGPRTATRPPPPDASAPPAVSAIGLLDLAPPATAVPEAARSYAAGMLSLRDGNSNEAVAQFVDASRADPLLAMAHLRIAMLRRYAMSVEAAASFARASAARSTLSDRDRALLECVRPSIERPSIDVTENIRCLEDAVAKWPRDAELWAELGYTYGLAGEFEKALPPASRAIELDPKTAYFVMWRGWMRAYLGDFDGARRDLALALALAPGAQLQSSNSIVVAAHDGDCAHADEIARAYLVAHPDDPNAYIVAAQTALGVGKPREAVEELVRHSWARAPEKIRAKAQLRYRVLLDLVAGDFESADKNALALEGALADVQSFTEHAEAARRRIDIYVETGRAADAAKVADAFERRKSAWTTDPRAEVIGMGTDITPLNLAAMRAGGLVSAQELADRRSSWIASWRARSLPFWQHYLWVDAYARAAWTPADAEEALRAQASFAPLPRFDPLLWVLPHADAAKGTVHELAGLHDEAIPELQRATSSCVLLYYATEMTRASYRLGTALEAKGRKDEACAAYRVVLDRWGHASRSVTANAARARSVALGCAK